VKELLGYVFSPTEGGRHRSLPRAPANGLAPILLAAADEMSLRLRRAA